MDYISDVANAAINIDDAIFWILFLFVWVALLGIASCVGEYLERRKDVSRWL